MHMTSALLQHLASCLEYPGADFMERLSFCEKQLADSLSSARFAVFSQKMGELTEEQREELFTRTLDILPSCVPYVSIHLFGEENFKRGELMARLSHEYAQRGFDAGGELPDHLVTLLRYVAVLPRDEFRDLAEYCLLGPIASMISAVGASNPYCALLESLQAVIKAEFPGLVPVPLPRERNFKNQMAQRGEITACGSGCCSSTSQVQPAFSNG